jgi:TonB family protein
MSSFSPTSLAPTSTRRLLTTIASVAFHAGFLAFVILVGRQLRAPVVNDAEPVRIAILEIAGGTHPVPIPLPRMDTAARTKHPAPLADAEPKNILHTKQPVQRPGGGSTVAPHAGNGSGEAMAGNGSDNEDARPAFPVFSPRPPVTDRDMLPASVEKVVVDVKIDVDGAVVSESLVSGIGNALDQIVLDTVKSWRFQPATVNGKPVPTQDELIFPFDHNYPITIS